MASTSGSFPIAGELQREDPIRPRSVFLESVPPRGGQRRLQALYGQLGPAVTGEALLELEWMRVSGDQCGASVKPHAASAQRGISRAWPAAG